MNKKIKEQWVKALRSGDYRQGRALLFANGCYCCLGVLCDIAPVGRWEEDISLSTNTGAVFYEVDNTIGCSVPPLGILQWADLGLDPDDDPVTHLVELNDHLNYDFNQIADWIEENL